MNDIVRVSYTNGQAEARIGERTLIVAQRNDEDRSSECPLELVSVALGS